MTGCIATSAVYLMSWALQKFLTRCVGKLNHLRQGQRQRRRAGDEESQSELRRTASNSPVAGRERTKGFISEASSMASTQGDSPDEDGNDGDDDGHHEVGVSPREALDPRQQRPPSPTPTPLSPPYQHRDQRFFALLFRNPFTVLSWFCFIAIGLPLRLSTGSDGFLSISLLFALWFSIIGTQLRLKRLEGLKKWPRARVCLVASLNPVLWTALGMIAYVYAESAVSRRPVPEVLDILQRNNTLTDLILHQDAAPTKPSTVASAFENGAPIHQHLPSSPGAAAPGADPTGPMVPRSAKSASGIGPGDVALAILYAGLVSWGLKLWQYRRRLASRAGATILCVSTLAALFNVVLGPPLARAIGLADRAPSYPLAFAARTATLALGGPALARLGGDLGLNAALVVANGILFQMGLGLGAGRWLSGMVDRLGDAWDDLRARTRTRDELREKDAVVDGTPRAPPMTTTTATTTPTRTTAGTGAVVMTATTQDEDQRPQPHCDVEGGVTCPRTVAAGVTIGINAAAMGTAHLYEARSDAAPYAALSMTVFGVATVGFTLVPPLASWVITHASP